MDVLWFVSADSTVVWDVLTMKELLGGKLTEAPVGWNTKGPTVKCGDEFWKGIGSQFENSAEVRECPFHSEE